jgi:hypothetical protein
LHRNDPHEPRVWEAVRELFNRPWWSRIWTVQEASSSAQVDFICGNKTIDFGMLEKAIRLVKPLPLALLSGPKKTGHEVLTSTDFCYTCNLSKLHTSHPGNFKCLLFCHINDIVRGDEGNRGQVHASGDCPLSHVVARLGIVYSGRDG